MRRVVTLGLAYLVGAIPFSNVFAARISGVDLRTVGNGTVSGTGLYRVAGFKPLAIAGVLDIAKGALVTGLVRRSVRRARARCARGPGGVTRPAGAAGLRPPAPLESAAGGMVVVGHNWSPFLEGAGGRGVSPAMGVYGVAAPEATVLLLAGLVAGRLTHQTALGTLASQVAIIPVLAATRGRRGAWAGVAVVAPMLLKRVLGNGPPEAGSGAAVYLCRLLYDRDDWYR